MHNRREQHNGPTQTEEKQQNISQQGQRGPIKKSYFCVPALMTGQQDWQCQAASGVSALLLVQAWKSLDIDVTYVSYEGKINGQLDISGSSQLDALPRAIAA